MLRFDKDISVFLRFTSESIDPLNSQRVKGWEIVPTEDPKLHLVRERDKICITPVPVCFLNYEFWKIYLAPSSNSTAPGNRFSNRSAAIGFTRSDSHLIQYRLDFVLVQEDHLLLSQLE